MNKTSILLIIGAVVLLAVSCATAPKPAPVEEPPPVAVVPLPEGEYKQAQELRALIGKYALDKYAPEDFRKAEQSFREGEPTYGKDNAGSKAALEEAISGYQRVIDIGFPALTGERQQEAENAKAEADALFAAVSLKSEYDAALATYNQALKARDEKQYEKSLDLFPKAKDQFASMPTMTLQKKDRAEQAQKRAQTAKSEADTLKAAVAVKSEYAAAMDAYNRALQAWDEKRYDESLDLYQKTEALFTSAAQTARGKKTRAEQALTEAAEELKQAEQQALEADKSMGEGR